MSFFLPSISHEDISSLKSLCITFNNEAIFFYLNTKFNESNITELLIQSLVEDKQQFFLDLINLQNGVLTKQQIEKINRYKELNVNLKFFDIIKLKTKLDTELPENTIEKIKNKI